MTEKSVIIIGAGLAGLSTGCYAQMNGYRTRIYEQHTRAGGVCTSWKRKGYTIDGCIHWLMGSKHGSPFHRLYREVGALEGNRLIYVDHYGRLVQEVSGQSLEITADLDRLVAEMVALSPEDRPVVDELVKGARALRAYDMDPGKPRELMGPLDGLKQMWAMRRTLKLFSRYNVPMTAFARRFRSPFLRWAVSNVFVPEMPTFFAFLLLAQLAAGELAFVEGGSLEFALAIARRYASLGGQIAYGAFVEEILVEEDRAVGVRLAGGSEHRADVVVSAADGYSTLFHMLGGRYADAKVRERYDKWSLFRPLLMISYGVARTYPDLPSQSLFRLQRPLNVAGRPVEGLMCRVFNQDPTLAPQGKTVVQALLETDFDYWYDLREERTRYEAEKARIAEEVLEQLEAHLPGLSAGVEMTDVATPYTFWRYTRNHRGAYEGWLMTPEQVRRPLPKTLPGLRNFYMAGQWVEPGGGIPPALYSGRQVVQVLCHRDGSPFSAYVP
jgi:phytoene dehydrogenase-like protein